MLRVSLFSAAVALLLGGLLIALAGYPVLTAYAALAQGAFGDMDKFADTLGTATPLIFTGLAVAVAIKGGVINIGCEGQLFMGGLAAAFTGAVVRGLPSFLHIALCMLSAMLAGGLWAMLAGWLKVRLHINEVVLTIMLNYVAVYFTDYIITNHFAADSWVVKSPDVQPGAVLPKLYPQTRLTAGFLIALVMMAATWYFLSRTTKGFEIRAMGSNLFAAESGGINPSRNIIFTMCLSGALAGMAGACEILGIYRHFISGFSPGYGYDGLAIAMLGQYNAFGVALAAVFIGALRSGATMLDRATNIPSDFVVVIQAVVILIVATPRLISAVTHRRGVKRKEEAANG
jgi:simple sugar transport system permease protein